MMTMLVGFCERDEANMVENAHVERSVERAVASAHTAGRRGLCTQEPSKYVFNRADRAWRYSVKGGLPWKELDAIEILSLSLVVHLYHSSGRRCLSGETGCVGVISFAGLASLHPCLSGGACINKRAFAVTCRAVGRSCVSCTVVAPR